MAEKYLEVSKKSQIKTITKKKEDNSFYPIFKGNTSFKNKLRT